MERRVDRTEEVGNQLRGLIAMRLRAMPAVVLRRTVAVSCFVLALRVARPYLEPPAV